MFRASSDRILKTMSTKVFLVEQLSPKDVCVVLLAAAGMASGACIASYVHLGTRRSRTLLKSQKDEYAEEERKEDADREAQNKSGHGHFEEGYSTSSPSSCAACLAETEYPLPGSWRHRAEKLSSDLGSLKLEGEMERQQWILEKASIEDRLEIIMESLVRERRSRVTLRVQNEALLAEVGKYEKALAECQAQVSALRALQRRWEEEERTLNKETEQLAGYQEQLAGYQEQLPKLLIEHQELLRYLQKTWGKEKRALITENDRLWRELTLSMSPDLLTPTELMSVREGREKFQLLSRYSRSRDEMKKRQDSPEAVENFVMISPQADPSRSRFSFHITQAQTKGHQSMSEEEAGTSTRAHHQQQQHEPGQWPGATATETSHGSPFSLSKHAMRMVELDTLEKHLNAALAGL